MSKEGIKGALQNYYKKIQDTALEGFSSLEAGWIKAHEGRVIENGMSAAEGLAEQAGLIEDAKETLSRIETNGLYDSKASYAAAVERGIRDKMKAMNMLDDAAEANTYDPNVAEFVDPATGEIVNAKTYYDSSRDARIRFMADGIKNMNEDFGLTQMRKDLDAIKYGFQGNTPVYSEQIKSQQVSDRVNQYVDNYGTRTIYQEGSDRRDSAKEIKARKRGVLDSEGNLVSVYTDNEIARAKRIYEQTGQTLSMMQDDLKENYYYDREYSTSKQRKNYYDFVIDYQEILDGNYKRHSDVAKRQLERASNYQQAIDNIFGSQAANARNQMSRWTVEGADSVADGGSLRPNLDIGEVYKTAEGIWQSAYGAAQKGAINSLEDEYRLRSQQAIETADALNLQSIRAMEEGQAATNEALKSKQELADSIKEDQQTLYSLGDSQLRRKGKSRVDYTSGMGNRPT